MKRIEITYSKHQKELEKLNAQLDRAKKAYEKKLAVAQKYGVDGWTQADHNEFLTNAETTEFGYLVNKADIKTNTAWFDMVCAEEEIKDIEGKIQRAEARLEKAETELAAYHEEIERVATLQEKEALKKLEFEQEQKEWLKDGIHLEARYYGTTPKGKRFTICGNSGYALRSLHCFQLIIEGETIFTSGEFWRAYAEIKKR